MLRRFDFDSIRGAFKSRQLGCERSAGALLSLKMPIDDSLRLTSEARLWSLIEERAVDGADVDGIDARIWELFGEQWAVMFTDLAGFSRKTREFGIIHFLQVIYQSKKLLYPIVVQHDGLIIKAEGDSLMLLFRTPARALGCAVAMQRAVQMASARMVEEEKILLAIGVGYGKMLRVGDHDVWGREVNYASKLGEDTAVSGEILTTRAVRDLCAEQGDFEFEPIDNEVAGQTDNFRLRYLGKADGREDANPAPGRPAGGHE